MKRMYQTGYLQSFQNLNTAERPTYYFTDKPGIEGGEPLADGWLGTVNDMAFYGHGLVTLMEEGRYYYYFEKLKTKLAIS